MMFISTCLVSKIGIFWKKMENRNRGEEAVCGLRCPVYGLRFAVCGLRFAELPIHHSASDGRRNLQLRPHPCTIPPATAGGTFIITPYPSASYQSSLKNYAKK